MHRRAAPAPIDPLPQRFSRIGAGWRSVRGLPPAPRSRRTATASARARPTEALIEAGCRDFFVSTWAEAEALGNLPESVSLVVLHGVGPGDAEAALRLPARPCLNTVEQVARWKEIAPERPCDVMVDTGMNRLGLRPTEIGAIEGLAIDTLHSHLACADEDSAMNAMQLERFRAVASAVPAKRYSFANSAGHLPRPRLQLRPRPAGPRALRRRSPGRGRGQHPAGRRGSRRRSSSAVPSRKGRACGYGATFIAHEDTEAAILNIGYADGYLRGFSSHGSAFAGEYALPVLGRVSMDLIAVGVDAAPGLREGEWVEIDYDLPSASKQSGLSQYELLTTLGSRFERRWV